MTTKRLYYEDSYLTTAKATVVSTTNGGLHAALDQTPFYPTSGGQPHDLGTMNGITVVDVIDDGDKITHVLASPLTTLSVEAQIFWGRRYDHMQQHTGQHLLSAVFEELFQIPTLSFHLGAEASTIELGTKELRANQIDGVAIRATEFARANAGIKISFEDAATVQGLRKTSQREGILRVIEIPGMDRSACGGTHVASLAEVLPVQIRDVEKLRGNIRISFVCGNRAVARTQRDFQMLSMIAASVATSLDNAEEQVAALKGSLVDSEKRRQRLEAANATRAGLELYQNTVPGGDGTRRASTSEAAIDEDARTKAKAFVSQTKAVILMYSSDGLLLACSSDSGINAGAILKDALAKYGARGGGSLTLAQGSLPNQAILQELAAALKMPVLSQAE